VGKRGSPIEKQIEKVKVKSEEGIAPVGDQKIDSNWRDDRSGKGKKDRGRVE